MLSVLMGVSGIFLVFTFIIAVHEFGHLIFMKVFGVKVFKYSICFGKPLISKKIGETEYSLGWIPLGGYVKPLSEEDTENISEEERHRSLEAKPRWQQMIIMFAGPAFNFISAACLFFILAFAIGFEWPTLKLAHVAKGLPAYEAGIRPGDVIYSVDGKKVREFQELQGIVAIAGGKSMKIGVIRRVSGSDLRLEMNVKPVLKDNETGAGKVKMWIIGIAPEFEKKKLGFAESVSKSVFISYFFTKMQIDFFAKVIKKSLTRKEPVEEKKDKKAEKAASSEDEDLSKGVSGPLGIFGILYSAANQGLESLINIAAVLNLAIGFMNLLPVYPLDGGRMMILSVEMVIRRKIYGWLRTFLANLGLVFLIGLMLWGTYNDIMRLAGK